MNQSKTSKEILYFLSDYEIKTFKKLQEIIRELNKISNLTRLIDGNDYWIGQVYDSVWPFLQNKKKVFDNKKFIDIGSGCGFPGFAYAITHPNSEIYLVDSSIKKISALLEIKNQLKLQNKITIINERIETLAHEISFRQMFDICTARALASSNIVSEYIVPLLNEKGVGLLYCGNWAKENETELNNALVLLKGHIQNINKKILPHNKGIRNIIYIKGNGKCPDIYPRGIGKPTKYPLGH